MKGLQWLLTHHLFAIHLARPRWGCTISPTSQWRKLPKSIIRVLPVPPAATHHQGIGEAQAHQASRELPVQGVGDGGGSCDEYHARSDVFLRKDSSRFGLL